MVKIALVAGGGDSQSAINISSRRATEDLRDFFLLCKEVELTDGFDAEIVVFVCPISPVGADVLTHPAYRKNPERCVVFDQSDISLALLPGLYTNVPSFRLDLPHIRFAHYLRACRNPYLGGDEPEREYLFSFVGSVGTCPRIRGKVLALSHPRAVLRETVNPTCKMDVEFADIMKKSKFVICPRGICGSTIRVFESMRSGCVPVIISDRWRPLGDLDWPEFSIRISEKMIVKVPDLLQELEGKAGSMGRRAREVFEENFSAEGTPDFLLKEFRKILASGKNENVNSSRAMFAALRNLCTAPWVMPSELPVCKQQLKAALRMIFNK